MKGIRRVDHIGIRVRQQQRAIQFYELLGFETRSSGGFDQGHPTIMVHPSGVVLNLLGPADEDAGDNILMDRDAKPAGYTHMALNVDSIEQARAELQALGIPLSGEMTFGAFSAVFVRDPDRNVIEFNEHPTDDLASDAVGRAHLG